MRKAAFVFVLAVFAPSLILAWLSIRSVSDQQIIFERQQTLLYQSACAGVAKEVLDFLAARQKDFATHVERLLAQHASEDLAATFDNALLQTWPAAEVGFAVSMDGHVLAPPLLARPEARRFRLENDLFLSNQESVEVYWPGAKNLSGGSKPEVFPKYSSSDSEPALKEPKAGAGDGPEKFRKVIPQKDLQPETKSLSTLTSAEAEFRQLIGDAGEGMIARFLQNRLKLLLWYRSPSQPEIVFGAQLNLPALLNGLRDLVQPAGALRADLCIALLDDAGRPVALSRPNFRGDWKRPFVSVEIGEALPHWEVAAYLLAPERLRDSEKALARTLASIVLLLVLAIGVGGWLLIADVRRQLRLARQKTDFVSNVSHELKTPLTSIRMFSELLANDRVDDEAKRRSFLNIITAEVARLTRLINNVLDFARLERGEQACQFQRCDLARVTRETVETYRPHLEAGGFVVFGRVPDTPCWIRGDRDALAQVLVNLLSNAEKYSAEHKEILVTLAETSDRTGWIELSVLDRGLGVPRGCEEKIFDQFYRAHDSLHSGIHGSGLGLTLARQIARLHGGDVQYRSRDGGGSCFVLRLPVEKRPSSDED